MSDHVYFAAVGDIVKVGFSNDPEARIQRVIRDDTTLKPEGYDYSEVVLLGTIPGGFETEMRVHDMLVGHRVLGEWFRLARPVIQAIDHL